VEDAGLEEPTEAVTAPLHRSRKDGLVVAG
jgi:hypothetical protein